MRRCAMAESNFPGRHGITIRRRRRASVYRKWAGAQQTVRACRLPSGGAALRVFTIRYRQAVGKPAGKEVTREKFWSSDRRRYGAKEFRVGLRLGKAAEKQFHCFHSGKRAEHLTQ